MLILAADTLSSVHVRRHLVTTTWARPVGAAAATAVHNGGAGGTSFWRNVGQVSHKEKSAE